jgi:hypothetical protein
MCKRIHFTALLLPLLLLLTVGAQAQQTFSVTYQNYHPDTLLVQVNVDAVSPQPSFPDATVHLAYDTTNLVYIDHIIDGTLFSPWDFYFTNPEEPESVSVKCETIDTWEVCFGMANYTGTSIQQQFVQGPGIGFFVKMAYKDGFDFNSRNVWMTVDETRVGTTAIVLYNPEAPDLLAPVGGMQVGVQPMFSWSETAGPHGTYTLEYSTDPGFGAGVVTIEDIPTNPPSESWAPGDDLEPGTYYWRVTAYNHLKRPSAVSAIDSFEVQACPDQPETPETSDTPVCVDSQFCLIWDHVEYAASYDVQVNGGTWESIGYVDEYCDTQAAAGDYEYRLRARNGDCDPSDPSDPVTVTVQARLAKPDAPTLVQNPPFCPGDAFTLQWTIDPLATRYEFRENDGSWVNIGFNDQRAITKDDPGVYYFQIRACDDVCGCSEPSDSLEVVVLGPPDPPVVSGPGTACVDQEFCLTWPSDPMVENYQISTDGGATWPSGTSDTFYCDTRPSAETVTYHVRACNSCEGCSDPSSAVEVTVGDAPGIPDVDGPGTACVDEQYCLSWSADPAADSFRISMNGGTTWSVVTTENSYCVTAADIDTITYLVQACGCGTCGDASEPVQVTTFDSAPAPPDSVYCRLIDGLLDVDWTDVPGAEYYLLYRDGMLMDSVTTDTFSGEVPPGSYEFHIAAGNACGTSMREFSCEGSDVHEHSYEVLPNQYSLAQNYPNPFNPETYIDFALPRSSHVTLTVYNMLGQQVRTLVDEQLSAGPKTATWDGTDDRGRPVSSGIYFYRIQATDFQETRKMVLMK